MTDDLKDQKHQDCSDALKDVTYSIIKLENELRDIRKEVMQINDLFYPVLDDLKLTEKKKDG